MKRVQQVAVGILASLTLGLAALSAHAQPGAAAGTGPGMEGAGQHQGKGAAGHQGHMAQAQQGAQGHGQHGATAGPTAGGCPMAAQHTAQNTHTH